MLTLIPADKVDCKEWQNTYQLPPKKPNGRVNSGKSRSCTVDGINIYPSRKALVEALGANKEGARSPSFRYINER